METCKQCNRPFVQVKPWQEFCCTRHQQDWHLHQRKLERREKLANGHDRGTPEQRKEASEVLARIIQSGQGRIVRRI
jgi:hypothetical protein